jgi:hypothetical protein
MNSASTYFDSGSRLSQDACAQSARYSTNDSVFGYMTTNFRPSCSASQQPHIDFALDHHNLRPDDGYAPPPCAIDTDSQLRQQPDTDDRRQRLFARTFHAAPFLGRGEPLPTLEHVLLAGQPSAACGPTIGSLNSNVGLPPLHPSIQQLLANEAQVTDAWSLQFGEPSRDALRKMRAQASLTL